MLVSGIVLICVFVLTLVFGIIRIVNTAPQRRIDATPSVSLGDTSDDPHGSSSASNKATDTYALAEEVSKLIIELVAILFAILGTFVLFRYVKRKYEEVQTAEPKAT